MSSLPAALLSEDQFSCSICLDIFNNPVSTPCGHSYCQACISFYWDTSKTTSRASKMYQCPLCKESFNRRPELHINRTLKEITEHFKRAAATTAAPPAADSRGADESSPVQRRKSTPSKRTDMPEGVINEMVHRFQKTSTEQHHDDPPPPYTAPRRYTVSSATDLDPSLPLCPVHLRGLAYFCRDENVCICSVCAETEHRGHNVTSAKREWQLRKSQLGILDVELKDQICERERKVQEIQSTLLDIKSVAERETDEAVSAFINLIANVERCQAEILEVIEMSRRAAEHKAQRLLKELEDELSELRKRSSALNQLTLTDNYVQFLTSFPSVSAPAPQTKDWSGTSVGSELPSSVVLKNITQTMERFKDEMCKLTEVWKGQKPELEQHVSKNNPKVRRVQEYAEDITLDPNTAHPRLVISTDGKQVFCGERHQPVPDSPERFDRVVCVLAREGFDSGRHYWEVEVGGKTDWDLGVASRSVCRKGKITVSPAHGYWFLSLRDRTDYAFRTEPSTSLTVSSRPSKIGVYVDYDKGTVSFYNVDAKMLIYTFTDRFTDVILPFFSPCTNKSGRNEAPLIICPVSTIE